MFGRGKILQRIEAIERKLEEETSPTPVLLPDMFASYKEPSGEERREWLGEVVGFYDNIFAEVLRNQINQAHGSLARSSAAEVELLRGHLSALYTLDEWFLGCKGELESLILN